MKSHTSRASAVDPGSMSPGPSHAESQSKEVTLLLVEDHEIVRKGLHDLMEGYSGWRVCCEAASGNEAIEKTLALNPDLVAIDQYGGNGRYRSYQADTPALSQDEGCDGLDVCFRRTAAMVLRKSSHVRLLLTKASALAFVASLCCELDIVPVKDRLATQPRGLVSCPNRGKKGTPCTWTRLNGPEAHHYVIKIWFSIANWIRRAVVVMPRFSIARYL
jgi:CheY-like chemotaxis protein